jgi:excisionase family DNA binding protein
MIEEWLLTMADVAESLGCSIQFVEKLVADGKLSIAPGHVSRIAHSELRKFVTSMQSEALALGVSPLPVTSLLASQPIHVDHEDETTS